MVHASLRFVPREIGEDERKYGSVVAVWNSCDNLLDKGGNPLFEGAISSASGKVTDSPE